MYSNKTVYVITIQCLFIHGTMKKKTNLLSTDSLVMAFSVLCGSNFTYVNSNVS